MNVVAITGASSFIGKYLLKYLSKREDIEIRVLLHDGKCNQQIGENNVTKIEGNLLKSETLDGFVVKGCTLVNLVHLHGRSKDENIRAIFNLAEVSAKAEIKRFIHCSTAVVSGWVPDETIDENTKCNPIGEYEKTKLSVEKLLWEKYRDSFEVVILRPTAVFGPNGKNLLKMANDLSQGSKILNYVKSCLFNLRKMNLVYVDNVVLAIVFLIDTIRKMEREIFIISDDEYDSNNYRDIEKYLMKKIGHKSYPLPIIPLPSLFLSIILKLFGESHFKPNAVYDCRKLLSAGFRKEVLFEDGLAYFADWYKKKFYWNQ